MDLTVQRMSTKNPFFNICFDYIPLFFFITLKSLLNDCRTNNARAKKDAIHAMIRRIQQYKKGKE